MRAEIVARSHIGKKKKVLPYSYFNNKKLPSNPSAYYQKPIERSTEHEV